MIPTDYNMSGWESLCVIPTDYNMSGWEFLCLIPTDYNLTATSNTILVPNGIMVWGRWVGVYRPIGFEVE